jgi:hypothetical protein
MHTGEKLGEAIKIAVQKKIASGGAKSKVEIARHFRIQPPSMYDWFNRGSIDKGKLQELFRYFSDVVTPDHWGITKEDEIFWNLNEPKSVHDVADNTRLADTQEKQRLLQIIRDTDNQNLSDRKIDLLKEILILDDNKIRQLKKFVFAINQPEENDRARNTKRKIQNGN